VRLAARYPLLRVELDLSTQRQNLIEQGFDCAIRGAAAIEDATLVARRLVTTETQLFAAAEYLARRGTPETPEELADHECVLFRPLDGRNEWMLQGPGGEQRLVTVTGRIAGNDHSFLRSVIRAGAGIGGLPRFPVTDARQDEALVRAPRAEARHRLPRLHARELWPAHPEGEPLVATAREVPDSRSSSAHSSRGPRRISELCDANFRSTDPFPRSARRRGCSSARRARVLIFSRGPRVEAPAFRREDLAF
jgi:DNA-binding transcriptional LysR family regulator